MQGEYFPVSFRLVLLQVRVQNSSEHSEDAFVEFVGKPELMEKARAALEKHLISFSQNVPHHALSELQLAEEREEASGTTKECVAMGPHDCPSCVHCFDIHDLFTVSIIGFIC